MQSRASLPLSRDLVLVGGGHTHALVLRAWGMSPLPGVRVTLIHPGPTAPYSGMLPGHVAGHYTRDALDIDLVQLARFAKARWVNGAATDIDLGTRTVHVAGRPPIAFDTLALDIGITSDMPDLPGFAEHAVPAKPLGPFAERWATFRRQPGPGDAAVIGGGVAGAELAMAMAHALRTEGRAGKVTLIDHATALGALGPAAARRVRAALTDQGVDLLEGATISRITRDGVHLADGRTMPANFVTGAAGARPYTWLARSGLALQDGFVTVDATLQSSDPQVFATGDCAHMANSPRPKAGVYAVRQAPVLTHNLRVSLAETGRLRRYTPQSDYLKLISLGRKSALADRYGFAPSGPLMWRWKDRIDRAFMDKFRHLPIAKPPALPSPRAADDGATRDTAPLCGGCGAKIGQPALQATLGPAREDAAILATGGITQVLSTDHLRAMVEDPVTMTRIAAIHALGDIWAMGATPQAALVSLTLPRQSEPLAARALGEIMATAHNVFSEAGAEIIGGHSTLGAEFQIGFTVTGLCETVPITLAGARPGDDLVLTRPIGTGVIMAADMQARAKGIWVEAALTSMTHPQGDAARILGAAHAMTDVTGFGLAGHLRNLCQASQVGARLDLSAIPLLPGALDLARDGVRSTLFTQNATALPGQERSPDTDLLFDPQTGGGLLAALPDAASAVAALRAAGHSAACIGQITDRTGQIDIVRK